MQKFEFDLVRRKENLERKKRIYKICILDFYYAQNTLQYNTKEILTGAPIIFYSKRGGGVRIERGGKSIWYELLGKLCKVRKQLLGTTLYIGASLMQHWSITSSSKLCSCMCVRVCVYV